MEKDRRKASVAAAALALAGLGVLYAFPPGEAWFYPPCLIHAVTGWQCPGCGTLRALHAALHGRFGEAFGLNPWAMVTLPLLGVYGAAQAGALWRRGRYWTARFPLAMAGVLAAAGLAFGVWRNL